MYLVKHRVTAANQLGAHLRDVHSGRTDPAVLHRRLLDAPRGASGQHATSQAAITASYVALLRTLLAQIKALSAQIDQQLATHPDSHISTSLPRSGRVRAARLLAEIGDSRARFPTPESLTCLAGAAPSTRQSGRLRAVGFRWSCDKQLRDAVTDFANGSRDSNLWAADLCNRARARGHAHAHAIRILARAWLHVIWHCWQDHRAYDPGTHRALQHVLAQQDDAA
jgi:transposase